MGAQCNSTTVAQFSASTTVATREQIDLPTMRPPPPPPAPYNFHQHRSAQEPECCALCLQALGEKPLAVCTGRNGCRACSHFFHASCLRRVRPRKCPQCRAAFECSTRLPDINEDPMTWARLVSVRSRSTPSKKEIMAAFKAMLPLPPDEVEALVASFPGWANASEHLSHQYISTLAEAIEPHLPTHAPPSPRDEEQDEDQQSEHDGHRTLSSEGHQSSDIPGHPCSCGRIHAHRGDRVRRGPAFRGGMEDGGAGQLGTIVREEENRGSVFVQWDLAAPGHVNRYAWPADSMRREVEQVLFTDMAPGIPEVQTQSGLSSVAATEMLRRRQAEASSSSGVHRRASWPSTASGPTPTENEFRERPKLFNRVRVLPDEALVRQWFEACPECPCNRPDCRGGVRWNGQASRHLGREGYVLKVDERDDTMLVELTGRCNCKVWFPALAVQSVFDPDTVDEPRFRVGAHVESKLNGEWHRGVVTRVWWRPSSGWGNKACAPYSIKLFDGRCVFAPKDKDNLVRSASVSMPSMAQMEI